MTRREFREHVFRMLFTCDFYFPSYVDVEEQMDLYFSHESGEGLDYPPDRVEEEERGEVKNRVMEVCSSLKKIDSLLNETSEGWTTNRMGRTDLSILRLGVYELLFDDLIPAGVAINEAVLLAKKYGGDDSSSFINGILGRLQRDSDKITRVGREER